EDGQCSARLVVAASERYAGTAQPLRDNWNRRRSPLAGHRRRYQCARHVAGDTGPAQASQTQAPPGLTRRSVGVGNISERLMLVLGVRLGSLMQKEHWR